MRTLKHQGSLLTIREQARNDYYEWNRKVMDESFVAALKRIK